MLRSALSDFRRVKIIFKRMRVTRDRTRAERRGRAARTGGADGGGTRARARRTAGARARATRSGCGPPRRGFDQCDAVGDRARRRQGDRRDAARGRPARARPSRVPGAHARRHDARAGRRREPAPRDRGVSVTASFAQRAAGERRTLGPVDRARRSRYPRVRFGP